MTQREKLVEILNRYFTIGDSYAYNLTRVKEAFAIGTVKLDDFVEFDEEITADIADYLLENGVIVPPCKVGDTVYKLCTVNSRIKIGDMWDGKIVKSNCDRCGYKGCGCYDIGLRKHECDTMIDVIEEKTIKSLESIIKIMPYFGTIWFVTKEEAKKALAERSKNECGHSEEN